MGKGPDFSYVNAKGKRVAGAPAFVHHVYTEVGGVQAYNDEVGKAYIEAFVRAHSNRINKELDAKAKRNRLKTA